MENNFDDLSALIASFNQIYAKFAQKYELNFNELHFLYFIKSHHLATAQMISKHWSIPKQTVNSIRNKFIKKGYLSLLSDQKDHRKRILTLTKLGKQEFAPMFSELSSAELKITSLLNQNDFAQFIQTFERVKDLLDKELN